MAAGRHGRSKAVGTPSGAGGCSADGKIALGLQSQTSVRQAARPSVRKGCLRLAQSGRREAGSMAAPAGKLTTTAPFFIGGILRRKEDTKVDHSGLTPAGGDKGKGKHHPGPAKTLNKNLGTPSRLKRSFLWG